MVVSPAVRLLRAGTMFHRRRNRPVRWSRHAAATAVRDWGIIGTRPASVRQGAARAHRMAHDTLWTRFADDQDLVPVKLMVLAGLIVLTAVFERVV